jgi:uncharacterized protein (DUF58 family)
MFFDKIIKPKIAVDNVVDKPQVAVDNTELVQVNLTGLIQLAKLAKGINLRHQQIRSLRSGGYLSLLRGRGMAFEEVRLYQAGDDVRSIDWKVTAKTNKPYTKIFREEHERPVFISVDYSKTMYFATRGVFKSVQAAKLAALIAWAAQQQGDRIGGQIFTEEACQEIKPQNGKKGVLRFLNTLVNPDFISTVNFSFEQVIGRLQQHAKPGSLLYLISDFRGVSALTEQYLVRLSRHCQLVLIFIYDPLEKALPETGYYRFTNDQREVVIASDDTQKRIHYQQQFQSRYQRLQAWAKKLGCLLIECETTTEPLECLR